jgi:hypothetical protein
VLTSARLRAEREYTGGACPCSETQNVEVGSLESGGERRDPGRTWRSEQVDGEAILAGS